MCVPLAAAALAVTAVGVGVQAYGAYQETKAQNAAAEYNARILENNAQVARYQAADAKQRGEVAEKQFRLRLSQEKGAQRALYGASGAVVDSGSALDVLEDTAAFGEFDALTIRHNAVLEAYGHETQSQNYVSQANLSRMQKRSAGFSAASTLLTGGSSLLNQGATYKAYGLL